MDVVRKAILSSIIIVAVILASYSAWSYMGYLDYLNKTIHETDEWVVIKDSKGDIIAVETTSNEAWNQLTDLHDDGGERWIGGIVEEYNNTWGFRFNPDTIIIAEITIEGAQSNIQGISGNLEYWINVWANVAYVMASVEEIHE